MRSPERLRHALVRGQRAQHWLRSGAFLVLRHPSGKEETEVPLAHLASTAAMEEHYARLAAKEWVTSDAVDELADIAAGART